jgi:hypothetical protein
MALKTNYPDPPEPAKEPQPKDQGPLEHDTTSGKSYGTTEGVKDTKAEDEAAAAAFEKQKKADEDATGGPVPAKK